MQVINDVECKSANDLKTILKANNKETPNWFFRETTAHDATALTN